MSTHPLDPSLASKIVRPREAVDNLIGVRPKTRPNPLIVGGVLPASLIAGLSSGTVTDGLSSGDFHLGAAETVRDAAARAWSYLRPTWLAWREQAAGAQGAARTRDRWLLPLLRELGYGQVPVAGGGITVEDVSYPISHLWQHVPVHLLGPAVDLDRKNPGVQGAARAPQAMLQELLNRSEPHLWAVLSNGLQFRLLRDSTNLVGPAYVEFDLEAIFDGEQYADWLLLFQLCHESRLEKREGPEASPADCWLETWRADAEKQGARALDRLRDGVENAITQLGSGFISHPGNAWLVDGLRSGRLTTQQYHRMLLRLVYRMLFVFVAEDRDLLMDPAADDAARQRYVDYFSTARLRQVSRVRRGSSHADLWQSSRLVLQKLGDHGLPELGLPGLGGLFDPDPRMPELAGGPEADLLLGADISNEHFLGAVRRLAWMETAGQRVQPVDYRHLGAEELGGVYESLLELVPELDLADRSFRLVHRSGNDRKTTGSYYTPPSLVSALLDSALDPVIEKAAPIGGDPLTSELALMELKVCDPACGSGGFLVAATRRIARRLAEVRAGDDQPTEEQVTKAIRDVVGHCVYGVDLNDLAAELAQVSLWLEAMQPGKPLRFLGHRIRTGNALMGVTPALLRAGVPDEAFKPLEGDDKQAASEAKKRNKLERQGQRALFDDWGSPELHDLAEAGKVVPDSVDGQRAAARDWRARYENPTLARQRLQADAWCAAFVWPLGFGVDSVTAPTTDIVRRIGDPRVEPAERIVAKVRDLAHEYRFFHWHLEFPEVFRSALGAAEGPDGWAGGFDCLVGNPPWDHVEVKEKEFFGSRDPGIAAKSGATRKRAIAQLKTSDPVLFQEYSAEKRYIEDLRHFLSSGRYPLTGKGRVKTDFVFSELFRQLTSATGNTGIIVPLGIATGATTQAFFDELVQSKSLISIYGFDYRSPLFKDMSQHFCLLTFSGIHGTTPSAKYALGMISIDELHANRYTLTSDEVRLLNPNTGTCPVFRTRRDAEITLGIYRRVPVLIKEGDAEGNPWGISFMQGLFNMTSDSHLFRTRDELEADGWTLDGNVFVRGSGEAQERTLPLYEAKMIHHYDDRWATYERDGSVRDVTEAEKRDPAFAPMPRYWVSEPSVDMNLGTQAQQSFLFGFRDVTNSTNERTAIFSRIPKAAVGHTMPLITGQTHKTLLPLTAILSSHVADYVVRQKIGGTHLTYNYVRQMAVPSPSMIKESSLPFDVMEEIGKKATRLLDKNLTESTIRASLMAEIDAICFHLYGISREQVDYVMESFPISKGHEQARHGVYRTKALVLRAYDAMQDAIDSGSTYSSPFDGLG